jgi:hypothetical protein
VTLGAGLALTGCVLLVFSLADAMDRVRSVEMRQSLASALAEPPGSGLGIDVDSMVDLLRVLVLVSAGLAAAGAVLAGFAFARHRGARVALSVTSVLLLLTATFVSGLLPILVAVAVTMLWSQDARDWFAGRAPRPVGPSPSPAAAPHDGVEPPAQAAPSAPSPSPSPTSAPAPGVGAAWQQQPQPGGPPPSYAYPYPPQPASSGRPRAVALAAGLTWAFAGVTTLFLLLLLLTLAATPSQLVTELQRNPRVAQQGYSRRELLGVLWVTGALGLFWCLSAMVLAVLAFRRVNAARIALVVSCVFTVVVGSLSLIGVLHAVAAVLCGVLLLRGPASRWYAGRADQPAYGGPQGPSGPPQSGPPQSGPPPDSPPPSGPPPPAEHPADDRRTTGGKPPVW